MPAVSVIMSVYNGERFLAEAIDSILAQTFRDFEFIIVDDGSRDGTSRIIESYAERERRIRFIPLARNLGIADARNRGIEAACGEFITIMDCDDISMPQRLEKQANYLRAHPQVGAAGTAGAAYNADMSRRLFDLDVPQAHGIIVFATLIGLSFIFSSVMTRAELLRAVGGYQPGLRIAEERDLYWRLLWQKRARFANLPDSLYHYRLHENSNSHSRDQELNRQRETVRQNILRQLWGEAPADAIDRFVRMATGQGLSMGERRSARRDMLRLIDALLQHGLVDEGDRPLLLADMQRRLEGMQPRLWQKFSHWRRYRFPRLHSWLGIDLSLRE